MRCNNGLNHGSGNVSLFLLPHFARHAAEGEGVHRELSDLGFTHRKFLAPWDGFEKEKSSCDPVTEELQAGVKLHLPSLEGDKSFANGNHCNVICEHALDVPPRDYTCPDWWSNVVITIDLDLTFDPLRRALKSFFISHLFWVMPLHLPLSQSFANSPPGQILAGFWLYMPREKYALPTSANTPRASLIFLKEAWESLVKAGRAVLCTSTASDENKKCSTQHSIDWRHASSPLTLRAIPVSKSQSCLSP